MEKKFVNSMAQEIALMNKWIKEQDHLVDYIEISEALELPTSTVRKYLIDGIRKGIISEDMVAYTLGGKNFNNEAIVHLRMKNPKVPGIKCKRCI